MRPEDERAVFEQMIAQTLGSLRRRSDRPSESEILEAKKRLLRSEVSRQKLRKLSEIPLVDLDAESREWLEGFFEKEG